MRTDNRLLSSGLYLPDAAVCPITKLAVRCVFNARAWLQALRSYPDQSAAQALLCGMREGVDIRFAPEGNRDAPRSKRNLPMPRGREEEAEQFVARELASDSADGRRAGPYPVSPFPVYRISPFGVVTKKSSAKLRLIHHLSWPRGPRTAGSSINSSIEKLKCQLSTFEDAIDMLNRMGDLSDIWMLKLDVKSAYRCIPVRPKDWPLLGGRWDELMYFDMSLPFGMGSSCGIWECYSPAIQWIAERYCKLTRQLIHYIDDFLAAIKGKANADEKKASLIEIFGILGVPLSTEKLEGPVRQITFLGILIDLDSKQIRLDEEKLQAAKDLIREWLTKQKCTRKQLQSLAGSLLWTTKVVRGGRIFLSRTITAIRKRPHNISLPVEESIKGDLMWWSKFIKSYNGVSMLPESKWTESWSDEFRLFTDASGSGFGARWGDYYLYGLWSPSQLEKAKGETVIVISVLELAAVIIAAKTWGHSWTGKRIIVRSDNTGAVTAINTGACRQEIMIELIRELWFICCTHSFEIRAIHVAGVVNVDADDLSRGAIDKFRQNNPTANSSPTPHVFPNCLN